LRVLTAGTWVFAALVLLYLGMEAVRSHGMAVKAIALAAVVITLIVAYVAMHDPDRED
jgi:hypothetical protein